MHPSADGFWEGIDERLFDGGFFWDDAYLGTMDEVSHGKSSVSARSLSAILVLQQSFSML